MDAGSLRERIWSLNDCVPSSAAQLTVPTENALSIPYRRFQHQETQPWSLMCVLQRYNLSTSRKLGANCHESLVAGLSCLAHYIGVSTKQSTHCPRKQHPPAHPSPQQHLRACIQRLTCLLNSYIQPQYKITFKGFCYGAAISSAIPLLEASEDSAVLCSTAIQWTRSKLRNCIIDPIHKTTGKYFN